MNNRYAALQLKVHMSPKHVRQLRIQSRLDIRKAWTFSARTLQSIGLYYNQPTETYLDLGIETLNYKIALGKETKRL
jgi:hypothetical protein